MPRTACVQEAARSVDAMSWSEAIPKALAPVFNPHQKTQRTRYSLLDITTGSPREGDHPREAWCMAQPDPREHLDLASETMSHVGRHWTPHGNAE